MLCYTGVSEKIMLPSLNTTKFGFRIRTPQGLVVEHLMIHGRDEADAERKLRQMYLNCEVMERSVMRHAAMQLRIAPDAQVGTGFDNNFSLISMSPQHLGPSKRRKIPTSTT